MTSTFQTYQFYAKDPVRSARLTAAEPAVKREKQYYEANIGKVKTVDDLVNNYRLLSYAATAYGLADKVTAKALLRKVLTSDLADPHSYANKLTDTRYKDFAKAFGFTTKGKLTDTAAAQASDQRSDTDSRYTQATLSNPVAAALETQYYDKTIASVTSLDGLVGDTRLLNYVLKAYGVAPDTSTAAIKSALESDVSDPANPLNASANQALKAMAEDFNFAADGSVTGQRLAISLANFKAMASAYTAAAGSGTQAQANAKTESTYVGTALSTATSLDTLLGDSRIVAYVGKAFGVPSIDAAKLRKVLTSDLDDPKSTANALGGQYRAIAEAFDVTKAGTFAREPTLAAQTRTNRYATGDHYLQQVMETEAGDQNAGVRLALYFKRKAPGITGAFEILADPALLQFVQTVLSLPAATANTDIDLQARAITSKIKPADLRNPAKLEKLVQRFTVLYDLKTANQQGATSLLQLT